MVSIRGVTRRRDDGAASRGATVDVFRDEWCVYCTVLLKLIEIIIITHRTAIHARIVRDETLDSDSASDDGYRPSQLDPSSSIEVARDVNARRRARRRRQRSSRGALARARALATSSSRRSIVFPPKSSTR